MIKIRGRIRGYAFGKKRFHNGRVSREVVWKKKQGENFERGLTLHCPPNSICVVKKTFKKKGKGLPFFFYFFFFFSWRKEKKKTRWMFV